MADMERPVDNLTCGPRHHFFGYYDKCPWDSTGRCDLHPRWNRDGTQVCFDSAHEGERQVYAIDVRDAVR
jgi:hypothetical protein